MVKLARVEKTNASAGDIDPRRGEVLVSKYFHYALGLGFRRAASYGDFELLKLVSSSIDCVCSIEFQRLTQSFGQRFE